MGLDIRASWIDWPPNFSTIEPSSDAWAAHWTKCVDQAAAADALLLVMLENENHCGALVEAGAALASGRRVHAVLPSSAGLSFRYHPSVQVHATVADAIKAITASST
jgi:hypothetical protein